jgi:hypothetical protein
MPSIVILALAWVTGLYSIRTRNARFVGVGLLVSTAWLAASVTTPPLTSLQNALAIGFGLIVLGPQVVGVASVKAVERLADAQIEGFDPRSICDTSSRLESLERVRRLVPKDAGRIVAARLALWAAAQRHDPQIIKSTVRADYFAHASVHFLRDAQWRRILGTRKQVSPWDEDIALRCFHYESANLIPRDVFAQQPPVALGRWADSVDVLLADLANAPLRDEIARHTRMALFEAIEALLRLATGDRSGEAEQHHIETAAAMDLAWQAMTVHLERLRPG